MRHWTCKKFEALLPAELYDCLRLRSEIFVVEQSCIFLDMDNNDQQCYHLMGWHNGRLAAYSRLVPPGVIYTEASIGRVLSSPLVRGTGAGKELMQQSIKKVYELFGNDTIKIGAQFYLKKFYESFGFVQTGNIYVEDGIEHIYMLK